MDIPVIISALSSIGTVLIFIVIFRQQRLDGSRSSRE